MRKNNNKQRKGTKALIYSRYSCDKQNETSIEGQVRECQNFAQHENIDIVDTYADRAMTGRNANRPALLDCLERLSADTSIKYLLVYKIDRLSRNPADTYRILETLETLGVKLLSAKEPNSDDSSTILTQGLNIIMASHYSAELGEKTSRGMYQCAINGTSIGSLPPFGYKWEKISADEKAPKKLVIDKEKAPAAKLIFKWYAEGVKKSEIARRLNELGYSNRYNKPFKVSDFENMLKNRKYIGEWWINGELVNQNGNKAIIDRELYEQVQAQLAKNQRTGAQAKAKQEYLISGLIRCGECDAPMVANGGVGREGKSYYYYKCKCCRRTVRRDIADDFIVKETILNLGLSDSHDLKAKAKELAEIYADASKEKIAIAVRKKELRKAEKEADAACTALLALPTSQKLQNALKDSETRIEMLKSEIEELEKTLTNLPSTTTIYQWLENIKTTMPCTVNLSEYL